MTNLRRTNDEVVFMTCAFIYMANRYVNVASEMLMARGIWMLQRLANRRFTQIATCI
mgnify:CR=1 FL=1